MIAQVEAASHTIIDGTVVPPVDEDTLAGFEPVDLFNATPVS